MPPGLLPHELPESVVVLSSSADNILFNMYCAQLTVINLSPAGQGKWSVWSQPPGKPWYVQTRVDLVVKDLENSLNTPYFHSNPQQKQNIQARLVNLSHTSFSLEQLILDLDRAVMITDLKFEGIAANSNFDVMLRKRFANIHATIAKTFGEPLLAVQVVSHAPGPSQLQTTAIERQVSVLVDSATHAVIKNPSKLQRSATTLNYLCAVNQKPAPGRLKLQLELVNPADIDEGSGIIAINRNTLGNFWLQELLPFVKQWCLEPTANLTATLFGEVSFVFHLAPGQSPQVAQITPSGPNVIHISYTATSRNWDRTRMTPSGVGITPKYTCDVSFVGNTITVVQNLSVELFVRWGNTVDQSMQSTRP
jgi:hypothetical protein